MHSKVSQRIGEKSTFDHLLLNDGGSKHSNGKQQKKKNRHFYLACFTELS